jgi:hypothetical protein
MPTLTASLSAPLILTPALIHQKRMATALITFLIESNRQPA